MKYELGHIYKIVCNLDNSFCYIGSTFQKLDKRWKGHKEHYKNKYGTISIHKYFDKYGIEKFKIELIKSYNVVRVDNKDSKHLHAYETLHINKNKKIAINLVLPFTPMRYLNQKEWHKKYRENNQEKIDEKNKKWKENNKEKKLKYDKEYYEKNQEKKKEYRENNKEKNQEYSKEYREKNKDKIHKKFNCECGGKYTHQTISTHLKTKKHIKFLENN
tara:strand:+ start:869 stop:1519 length:651 start_codon:yes stop_codon:yes gene_type:complete